MVGEALARGYSALDAGRWAEAKAVFEAAESTPLVQWISPDVYARIRTGAHHILAPFTTADGRVEAPFESNLVVAHPS
jgi:hypothetical protein